MRLGLLKIKLTLLINDAIRQMVQNPCAAIDPCAIQCIKGAMLMAYFDGLDLGARR